MNNPRYDSDEQLINSYIIIETLLQSSDIRIMQ